MRVANESAAAFELGTALLRVPGISDQCLRNVTIKPEKGSSVQYLRFGTDRAEILVTDGSTEITPQEEGEPARRVPPPAFLFLDPADKSCAAVRRARLPLNGYLDSLGEQKQYAAKPNDPTLLSGNVRLMIGAAPVPFQDRLGFLGVPQRGEVHEAGAASIPAGSTLLGGRDKQGEQPDWWGFADLDLADASAPGMDVVLPTPFVTQRGEPTARLSLSLSMLERCLADPTIRYVVTVLGLLAAAFLELPRKIIETRELFLKSNPHAENRSSGVAHGKRVAAGRNERPG